jgi:hypothetical protein
MEIGAIKTFSLPSASAMTPASARGVTLKKAPANLGDRKTVGEFVGNVFYGTLLKQMQESKLKGPFMHGGRGEEVFGNQLAMELAKRMGQSPNDPLAERLYKSIAKRKDKMSAASGGKVGAARS